MCVQVNIQNVTKSLRVQVTPCSDHSRWGQAALPPGNVGHDVHWTRRRERVDTSESERAERRVPFSSTNLAERR